MSDETIEVLVRMINDLKAMPPARGKSQIIKKIESSIHFLTVYRVGSKVRSLIIAEREKEIERLGDSKEYVQAKIAWRKTDSLRDDDKIF